MYLGNFKPNMTAETILNDVRKYIFEKADGIYYNMPDGGTLEIGAQSSMDGKMYLSVERINPDGNTVESAQDDYGCDDKTLTAMIENVLLYDARIRKQFEKRCYELYQLEWMMRHNRSVEDILMEVSSAGSEHDGDEDLYPEDAVCICCDDFRENLFGGEGYACFEEFMENEFHDRSYMQNLLKFVNPKMLD